jgi:hypothetical protein
MKVRAHNLGVLAEGDSLILPIVIGDDQLHLLGIYAFDFALELVSDEAYSAD